MSASKSRSVDTSCVSEWASDLTALGSNSRIRFFQIGRYFTCLCAQRTSSSCLWFIPSFKRRIHRFQWLDFSWPLRSIFQEIYPTFTHKTEHFKALLQGTKVPYEEMLFFDDEDRNVNTVSFSPL